MNLKILSGNQIYNVVLHDINARPIRVDVDGEIFEVWPELSSPNDPTRDQLIIEEGNNSNTINAVQPEYKQNSEYRKAPDHKMSLVQAPIPGVITAVSVQVGAEVTVGQELCKLEAMKMNNSIRATHTGIISAIHVSIGEHVKYNEVIMEYAD